MANFGKSGTYYYWISRGIYERQVHDLVDAGFKLGDRQRSLNKRGQVLSSTTRESYESSIGLDRGGATTDTDIRL